MLTAEEAQVVGWWLEDAKRQPVTKGDGLSIPLYDAGLARRFSQAGLVTMNLKGDGICHVNRLALERSLKKYREKREKF